MTSQPGHPNAVKGSTAEEEKTLREWVQREEQKREQERLREQERQRRLGGGQPLCYCVIPLNPLGEDQSITDFAFRYKLSTFRCPACKQGSWKAIFAYPHLDPSQLLSPAEMKLFDGKSFRAWGDEDAPESPEMVACLARLNAAWGVPVAPGTSFGFKSIKVGRKPRYDFEFPGLTGCLFARRHAVRALMTKGFDFDFVDLPAKGKYADEADFVQLVVPVVAHEAMVEGATFCSNCNRVNENRKTGARPRCLFDSAAIHQWPFFMTIEHGTLLLSPALVDAALKLGLKGWVHGETLEPWPVLPDPVPALPPLRWARPAASKNSAAQPPQRGEGTAGQRRPPTSVLDRAFAENWLVQLARFLKEVEAQGGKTRWTCGEASAFKLPAQTPEPLRVLLGSCGGRLSFRYEETIQGRRTAGSFDLDAARLGKLKAGCKKWAKETWIAEDSEEQGIWLQAFPFAELRNGDFLALDGRTAVANPAVLRLRHDDSSEELSPSLGDFLTAWQGAKYADFDDWETSE